MNSYYSKVYIQKLFGGEGGIRTPVTVSSKTDFESVPFNRALALLQTTIAALGAAIVT